MAIDRLPYKPVRRASNEFGPALPVGSASTMESPASQSKEVLSHKQKSSRHALLTHLDSKYGKGESSCGYGEDRWSSGDDLPYQPRLGRSGSSSKIPTSHHYLSILARELMNEQKDKTTHNSEERRNRVRSRSKASLKKTLSCPEEMRDMRRRHSAGSGTSLASLPTIQEFQRADDFGMENDRIQSSVRSLPSTRSLCKRASTSGNPGVPLKQPIRWHRKIPKASESLSLLVWDTTPLQSCLEQLSTNEYKGATSTLSCSNVPNPSSNEPPKLPTRTVSPLSSVVRKRRASSVL